MTKVEGDPEDPPSLDDEDAGEQGPAELEYSFCILSDLARGPSTGIADFLTCSLELLLLLLLFLTGTTEEPGTAETPPCLIFILMVVLFTDEDEVVEDVEAGDAGSDEDELLPDSPG